jgi:glycine cleavage system H protein
MPDHLTFLMGQFEARFPTDRFYARKNHTWAQRQGDGAWRFGFSAYAVRLLQDVYFLDWHVEEGVEVTEGQEIGFIESKKAESDLFAPMTGRLVRFNPALLGDPSTINVDNYGAGWLFEIEGPGENLMTPEEYILHLDSVWEVTQRTIKGQMNE